VVSVNTKKKKANINASTRGEKMAEEKELEVPEVQVAESRYENLEVYTGDSGLEEIGQEDLVIPRVSIGQEKTPNILPEEIGTFRNNVSGETKKVISGIAILLKKTRLMMPEDFDSANKTMCVSVDFVVPDDSFLQTPGFDKPGGDKCATCEYAKSTKKSNGKPKPPRCNEVWNFLTLDDNFDIFWQSFKSSALSGVRKYVSALSMQMKIKKANRMWAFSTEQKIVETKPGSGIYVPSFGKPELLSQEMLESADLVREEMKNTPVQVDMRYDQEAGKEEGGEKF